MDTLAGPCQLRVNVLIDAGGRGATLSRRLGARSSRQNKLICGSTVATKDNTGDSLSYIEAAEHGWWYSATLPDQRRVRAFHTDSDLPVARAMGGTSWLIDTVRRLPVLGLQLEPVGLIANTGMKLAAAHSAGLNTPGRS